MGCGGKPRVFLPFPLLFFFFGALVDKDLAQKAGLSMGPGLGSACEVVGLINVPQFLRIDCHRILRAACTKS